MKKLLVAAVLSLVTMIAIPAIAADKGAAPSPAKKTVEAAKPATVKAQPAAAAKQLVDINSATEAELRVIPGIGAVYAKKIADGRPYASKDQLLSKKILPKAVYDKTKDQMIAKQGAKTEAPAPTPATKTVKPAAKVK